MQLHEISSGFFSDLIRFDKVLGKAQSVSKKFFRCKVNRKFLWLKSVKPLKSENHNVKRRNKIKREKIVILQKILITEYIEREWRPDAMVHFVTG